MTVGRFRVFTKLNRQKPTLKTNGQTFDTSIQKDKNTLYFCVMGKHLSKLVIFALLIAIFGCEQNTKKSGNIIDFVPEDASLVLRISNWSTFRNDLNNNALFEKTNTTSLAKFLDNYEIFLNALTPTSENLFAIQEVRDSLTAFTFIAKQSEQLFVLDSLKDKKAETLQIDNRILDRIEIAKQRIFTTTVDSVFIASTSQEILMNILNAKTAKSNTFKRITQLPSSGGYTAFIRGNTVEGIDSAAVNFTTWSALDFVVTPETITGNGISLATDTIPQLLSVFEGQNPQQNHLAELTPMNAKSAWSFTFDDSEQLLKRLRDFRKEHKTPEPTGIFDSSSEIGTIALHSGNVVFIKSIDASITTDALARFVSSESTFRDVEIKRFSSPLLFKELFHPLIQMKHANFVFQLEDFFVFAKDERTAQEVIGSYLNKSILQKTPYYKQATTDLSSASSLLYYGLDGQISQQIAGFFDFNTQNELNKIDLSDFPLVALQFSYDRDFAHIALSARTLDGPVKNISKGISEKFHITLEHAILGDPQIFENNSSNVVVQDVSNTLHFISESGKTLWTKSLNSPILGRIKQVDLFKNGNQQMAFATENTVYILDRNGKDIGPFPLKFKDKITQPLAVFDYDTTRDYRFVVTQGNAVFMYDKKAKIVKGFTFKKTASEIVQPPTHIRMGNKDYIVIPEKNGKLNILNRRGATRVSVNKKFDFSEIPVTYEDTKFVVITKDKVKESISAKGKVSSFKLDVGSSYWFTIQNGVKATLDDNLLRIDGKLASLPIGYYSEPELYKISQTIHTAITELQEKKVYLFNQNGALVSGFPVYGSSKPSIGGQRSRSTTSMVVKGDANSIIVYILK